MEIKIAKKQCFIGFKLIISILFTFIDIPVYNNLNRVYHILLLIIKILKIIKEVKLMDINIKMNKIIGFMLSHYKRIKICSMNKKNNSLYLLRFSNKGNFNFHYHFYLENNEIIISSSHIRNNECVLSNYITIKL